ncbi:response regulator transcription factor [Planococcus kocurii]|uniref:response regulator transcription factor n=1 Tax=Planococcus kocurii TaxID=1374 RepID=UPI003D0368DD
MRERCKVLIVDDEMLIRQGILNYIDWKQAGFEIVGEASNGKEAMEMINVFSPDIVITDIVMPIMDGIDLVREAKKAFPNIEIIILSSFENFDYVRSTFQNGVADYILKPKLNGQELLTVLNRVADRIPHIQNASSPIKTVRTPEEILESMILGYDISTNFVDASSVFINNRFGLIGIHGGNLNAVAVVTIVKQAVLEELPVFLLNASKTEATLLFNFNSHQLRYIKEAIYQEKNEVSDETWVIYEPFDAIEDIKRVHDKGYSQMKKYLFYLPDIHVFSYDELPKENEKQAHFDLNHFIEMFKDRLFNVAFTYLENHVDYLKGRYHNDSFEFKTFLGNIIFNMIVLLETMKYDVQDIEQKKYTYFSIINEADHVHEALDKFNEFLDEVRSNILLDDKANDQSRNLNKILSYIEQHYTEPLRLSEIAAHFHFNASYLSSYFSTHHKEGFSEYLNRVRIKKSMELLENSQVSISNISGMVGYSEHSYFCKVFKRITGMSPGKYRKEFHANHDNEKKGLSNLKK